ncbi:MAG: hypothetical protein P4L41_02225 [Flavipsychrobacter sp.]|nr:hypothetical protein [Flavipsychrobacter sp.]
MTGTLAQLIVLTTYGNSYLADEDIPSDFYPNNSTFQFCNRVCFKDLQKIIVAPDPLDWFQYLKEKNCKKLRLYFQYSQDHSSRKDHQTAGFIGGGGSWLIEAIYDHYSNYWANIWNGSNKDAPDRRIWSVNYDIALEWEKTRNIQIDPINIKAKLRSTLSEIADFAFKHDLEHWGKKFESAKLILDTTEPYENFYHKDLIPLDNYSITAKQILFAAGSAWVFGGMGSWNDLGFDNKENQDIYSELSEKLYSNIIEAIVSSTNSF